MEALDRTLRALAPNDLVMQLYGTTTLSKGYVYEKNGSLEPTRRARVAAALHGASSETKLIEAQVNALAESTTYVTKKLQGAKHSSTGTRDLVRTWLVSVETILTQLLFTPQETAEPNPDLERVGHPHPQP